MALCWKTALLEQDLSFRILKQKKAFHIGKGYTIFTAELRAILMALSCLVDLPCTLLPILFCVDSKATHSARIEYC